MRSTGAGILLVSRSNAWIRKLDGSFSARCVSVVFFNDVRILLLGDFVFKFLVFYVSSGFALCVSVSLF